MSNWLWSGNNSPQQLSSGLKFSGIGQQIDVSRTCFAWVLRLFCRQHCLINPLCCSNFFQIMQHDECRVISTLWNHLAFLFNTYWYCFKVIKRYIFHYLMKSIPIPENQSPFKILQFVWYMALSKYSDILFSFCSDFNLKRIRWCLSCIVGQSSFRRNVN